MKSSDKPHKERKRWIRVIIWLISFFISGFYITSALGWFAATYMASAGMLGEEVTAFWQSLNTVDQVVRTSQVILIVVASIFLIFLKQIAVRLLLASLLLSLFSAVFVDKWGISFLAGPSVIMLTLVCCYTCWISRRGFLR